MENITPAPTPVPPPTPLFTTTDIAHRIAKTRKQCNPTSVWRAIRRLGIQPHQHICRDQVPLYTLEDVEAIERDLRAPNKGNDQATA